jgi:hypothetical protein
MTQSHSPQHIVTTMVELRLIIIIFLSFNDTVLLRNILDYCCMRRRQEWGAMVAVERWRPPWSVGAWFS